MHYIFFPDVIDIRNGGPSGYLANLREGLSLNSKLDAVTFLPSFRTEKKMNNANQNIGTVRKLIRNFNWLIDSYYIYSIKKYYQQLDLDGATIHNNNVVHFHRVNDYYYMSPKLPGKKVLTPHTPQSFAEEKVSALRHVYNNPSLKLNRYANFLKVIELEAFKACQYFIFPSKEAMSIYSDFIPDFEKIMKKKNVFFNMTGCKKLHYKLERDDFRRKNHIPDDAFLISFVGRHNYIKGFDLLADVAAEIYKINPGIYFVSGGTGEFKASSPNFIQIGWTDDPGSIIHASDLFVLPNRSTYFDLVLIEVLSLGRPVLASDNGGNITVSQLTEGVQLFQSGNKHDLIEKLLGLYSNNQKIMEMGIDNRRCYDEFFTLEKFANRYIDIMDTISRMN